MCSVCFHSSLFLQVFPVAPLFASSSAASLPLSLLCPFMCSNLMFLLFLTYCKSVLAFTARYLLLSALYPPVVIFAAYLES